MSVFHARSSPFKHSCTSRSSSAAISLFASNAISLALSSIHYFSGQSFSGGGVPKKLFCVPKSILFNHCRAKVTQVFLCSHQNVRTGEIHHRQLLCQDLLHAI